MTRTNTAPTPAQKPAGRFSLEYVASALTLIGLVVYIYTNVTGYFEGQSPNVWLVIMSILSIGILIFVTVRKTTLSTLVRDALLVVADILLLASFMVFVMQRVQLVADIYFIPVNHPSSENLSLNISFVGLAFYIVSIIVMIIVGFTRDHSVAAIDKANKVGKE